MLPEALGQRAELSRRGPPQRCPPPHLPAEAAGVGGPRPEHPQTRLLALPARPELPCPLALLGGRARSEAPPAPPSHLSGGPLGGDSCFLVGPAWGGAPSITDPGVCGPLHLGLGWGLLSAAPRPWAAERTVPEAHAPRPQHYVPAGSGQSKGLGHGSQGLAGQQTPPWPTHPRGPEG